MRWKALFSGKKKKNMNRFISTASSLTQHPDLIYFENDLLNMIKCII